MRRASVIASLTGCFALLGALDPAPAAAAADPFADLRRPLVIRSLQPGEPCPVSPGQRVAPGIAPGLGPGPIYPVGFDEESTIEFEYPPSPSSVFAGSGWGGQKTLWIVRPGYDGRILIRGAQLDGPNEVRFALADARLLPELAFSAGQTNAWSAGAERWRQFPTYTRVRSAGCYVFQIDTETFSSRVYFRAARVPGFPAVKLAPSCDQGDVGQLVRRFIGAFNGGRAAELDRLFAAHGAFKWYSAPGPGARLNEKAFTRSTLIPYLKERYALGERLRLVRLRRNGFSNGYFHFSFQLRRAIPEVGARLHHGKGAAVCTATAGTQIAVWSIGSPISG